jgi:hypothetical protein
LFSEQPLFENINYQMLLFITENYDHVHVPPDHAADQILTQFFTASCVNAIRRDAMADAFAGTFW